MAASCWLQLTVPTRSDRGGGGFVLPESTPVLPSGHAHMNEHTHKHTQAWTHMQRSSLTVTFMSTLTHTPSLCTCTNTSTIEMLMSEDKRDGKYARPFNSAQFTQKGNALQTSASMISFPAEIN